MKSASEFSIRRFFHSLVIRLLQSTQSNIMSLRCRSSRQAEASASTRVMCGTGQRPILHFQTFNSRLCTSSVALERSHNSTKSAALQSLEKLFISFRSGAARSRSSRERSRCVPLHSRRWFCECTQCRVYPLRNADLAEPPPAATRFLSIFHSAAFDRRNWTARALSCICIGLVSSFELCSAFCEPP